MIKIKAMKALIRASKRHKAIVKKEITKSILKNNVLFTLGVKLKKVSLEIILILSETLSS
jgi:hypothetical protein